MKLGRPDFDTYFMAIAHVVATRASCDRGPRLRFDPGRSGTGAVITRNNVILATGYNGSAPGFPHCDDFKCEVCGKVFTGDEFKDGQNCIACNPGGSSKEAVIRGGHEMEDGHCVRTIHSEENAILQCASMGTSCAGATVYVTTRPCYHCMKRVIRVGVLRVVYEFDYGTDQRSNHLALKAGIQMDKWQAPEGVEL